jgi:hypothetical protein
MADPAVSTCGGVAENEERVLSPTSTEANAVALRLGVSLTEAYALIDAGAMEAWQRWPDASNDSTGTAAAEAVPTPGALSGFGDDGVSAELCALEQPPRSLTRPVEIENSTMAFEARAMVERGGLHSDQPPDPTLCCGRFIRHPDAQNGWHRGDVTVRPASDGLWWENDAGASWSLALGVARHGGGGRDCLETGDGNPYRAAQPTFASLEWDARTRNLSSFVFGPDKFVRVDSSAQSLAETHAPHRTPDLAQPVDHAHTASGTAPTDVPQSSPSLPATWRAVNAAGLSRRRRLQLELQRQRQCGGSEIVNPPEEARSYSSAWDKDPPGHGAARSMLDTAHGWSAGNVAEGQWLQVDLGESRDVVGVWVQGRANNDQWVTQFRAETSCDGTTFDAVAQGPAAGDDVFDAAHDRNSKARVLFDHPIRAVSVRVLPVAWHGHPSARLAVECLPIHGAPQVDVDPAIAVYASDGAHEARTREVDAALQRVNSGADAVEKATAAFDAARAGITEGDCSAADGMADGVPPGIAPAVQRFTNAAVALGDACKKHRAALHHLHAVHLLMASGHRVPQGPHGAVIGTTPPVYTAENCIDPCQAAVEHTRKVTWSCFFPFLFAAALNAVGIPALTGGELLAWERVFENSAAAWSVLVARVVEANLGTPELTLAYWLEHSKGGTVRFHPDGETQSRLVLDRVDEAARTDHMIMVNAAAAELVQAGWVGGVRDDCKASKSAS